MAMNTTSGTRSDTGRRRLTRRRVLAATGAVGSLALAGCSSGSKNDGTPVGGDATELENRAKSEGKLTLYSVIDTPALNDIIVPAFTEDFPWATVEVVGLGPSKIASRMNSEYQSGSVKADVAWNTQTAMTPLESGGVFRKVTELPTLQSAFAQNDFPDYLAADYWVPGIQNPQTVIYNSRALSAGQVPDSYTGWTDAKWKGRLVFDHPRMLNVAGGEFASLYGTMSESKWKRTMEGIAANEPSLTQSASGAFRSVAQGGADLGIGLINNYIVGQQKSSPPSVEIKWVDPNVSLNVPIYLASDAKHPSMAVLFASWLMSPSGQLAAAKTGNTPTQPELAEATFSKYIPSDVELRPVASDVSSYYEKPNEWSERFDRLFA